VKEPEPTAPGAELKSAGNVKKRLYVVVAWAESAAKLMKPIAAPANTDCLKRLKE
jgi:hypothetical protein